MISGVQLINAPDAVNPQDNATLNNVTTAIAAAVVPATEIAAGIAEIATQVETNAGTDDVRFITPLKLEHRVSLRWLAVPVDGLALATTGLFAPEAGRGNFLIEDIIIESQHDDTGTAIVDPIYSIGSNGAVNNVVASVTGTLAANRSTLYATSILKTIAGLEVVSIKVTTAATVAATYPVYVWIKGRYLGDIV